MTSPLQLLRLLGVALTFFGAPFSAAHADIKVGVAVPLSGIYEPLGQQILSGAEFAARIINENGGIQGKTVRIESIDSKCDPTEAKAVANQLVGRGVIAVIGHLCDRPSIEASGVYANNKIVQISPTSENPSFTENRPLATGGTYRLAPRNTQQADVLSAFVLEKSINRKVAIVDDGSVYGKSLADTLLKKLKEKSITPALVESFESGEERYRILSARIVDSGATVVFIGGIHIDAATLIRDIDRLSQDMIIIGGDGLAHRDFPGFVLVDNENRKSLRGIFISFPPDHRTLDTAQEVIEAMQASDVKPIGLTLRGYTAMTILGRALGEAGTNDFDKINETLNQTTFQTPLSTIRFDEKGDANIIGYVMHEWGNNTLIPIN